jgi:hypothetical protein
VPFGGSSNRGSPTDLHADLFKCEHEQRWHFPLSPLPPGHRVGCHTKVLGQLLLSQSQRRSFSSQFISCHTGIVVRCRATRNVQENDCIYYTNGIVDAQKLKRRN